MSIAYQRSAETVGCSATVWPLKHDVFGVGISATTYDEAARAVVAAGAQGQPALVSCHAVHALMTFCKSPAMRGVANDFAMITPDGQPVRWALNLLHAAGLKDRVYGPTLTEHILQRAAESDVAVYLYGGSPATVKTLAARFSERYENLRIAGYESPPFRDLTAEEDAAVIDRINRSGAGIVLIGLGCPKQDLFAHAHRDSIRAVQVCVGAAFDFHAGVKSQAPEWMQRRGLEWFYRLCQEPKRLGRRYLTTNTAFVGRLLLALASRKTR